MTRHFWVLVHRYAGLYMAFFLTVAGLTGSILAFYGEINDWLNPPAKIVLQTQPRLDEFSLRERAEILQPQGQVTVLNFNRKPDEAYTAYFAPRTNPGTGKPYELAFNFLSLNPYSGAEISREKLGDDLWPITRKNFLILIVRLHYQLALPDTIGTWLFGIAALLWTVDCFVSAYLTFPLSVRRQQPNNAALKKSWLSRWKPSWLVKWRASTFRVNFDLHRAGGLWVWLMLLMLAWSSVGFNLNEQVYRPVMKAVFNMQNSYADSPDLKNPQPEPMLAWKQAYNISKQLMDEQAKINGFKILREETLQYIPGKGMFFYSVRSDRDVMENNGGTWLLLNGTTGKFAGLNIPVGQNAGTTLNSWIFALHTATVWGFPYKIFLSMIGMMVAVLSITGVYIWWKKQRAKSWSQKRLTGHIT